MQYEKPRRIVKPRGRCYHSAVETVDERIGFIADGTRGKRLLLHACCGPCAAGVLPAVTPHFDVTLFYFNPNILPKSEFIKRIDTLKSLLGHFPDVKLIVPEQSEEDGISRRAPRRIRRFRHHPHRQSQKKRPAHKRRGTGRRRTLRRGLSLFRLQETQRLSHLRQAVQGIRPLPSALLRVRLPFPARPGLTRLRTKRATRAFPPPESLARRSAPLRCAPRLLPPVSAMRLSAAPAAFVCAFNAARDAVKRKTAFQRFSIIDLTFIRRIVELLSFSSSFIVMYFIVSSS